jgi:hypothetical protein
MTDPQIVLDIRARIDDLKAKLRDAQSELGKLKGGADKGASGFTGLISAAKGFIAGAIASGIARVGFELMQLATHAERSRDALDRLTHGNADAYLQAVENATHGTVAEVDALAASNRALRLGVVQSADEMQQLTQVAVALGRTMGMDATSALSDLVTGIGRASPMILDNLGITLKQADIQKEVNRLMAEDATLTSSAAAKRATLNLVLRENNALLQDSAATAEDAASQTEQLAAEWTNFKVSMGQVVAEAITPALTQLNNLIDLTGQVVDAVGEHKRAAAMSSGTFEDYVKNLHEAGLVNNELALRLSHTNYRLNENDAAAMALRKEYEGLRSATFNEMESERAAAKIREQNTAAAQAAAIGMHDLADATDEATGAMAGLEKQTAKARQELDPSSAEGMFSDMFSGAADEAKAALEQSGNLQGLASVTGVKAGEAAGEFDKDAIREHLYQLFISAGADAAQRYRIRRALGLASAEEIEFERASMELVKAYLAGQISDSELGDAAAALESGDLTGARKFLPTQVSGPQRIMGSSGSYDPKIGAESSRGGYATPGPVSSSDPRTGGGSAGPNYYTGTPRVIVDYTGAQSLDDIVQRSVAAGLEAGMKMGGSTASKSGPPRAF